MSVREHENIFLIGPMGSGKTTIGRRVATLLEREFVDCDAELEAQTGASVNLIFDIEGEEGFRQRESRLLRQLARRTGLLVATGGGAVTRVENRTLLRDGGLVVWLQTSVSQQLQRLGRDKARPLLQTADREQRLLKLAEERDPLYRELADLVFSSSHRNARQAALKLTEAIRSYWRDTATEQACAGH